MTRLRQLYSELVEQGIPRKDAEDFAYKRLFNQYCDLHPTTHPLVLHETFREYVHEEI